MRHMASKPSLQCFIAWAESWVMKSMVASADGVVAIVATESLWSLAHGAVGAPALLKQVRRYPSSACGLPLAIAGCDFIGHAELRQCAPFLPG